MKVEISFCSIVADKKEGSKKEAVLIQSALVLMPKSLDSDNEGFGKREKMKRNAITIQSYYNTFQSRIPRLLFVTLYTP